MRHRRPRPPVRRISQPLRLLGLLVRVAVILDHDAARVVTRAISPTASPIELEMMRGETVDHDVERLSGERQTLGRRDRRPDASPGDGSTVTTSAPASRSRRATCPPPVATSSTFMPGPRLAQLHHEIEIGTCRMHRRRAIRLRALTQTSLTPPAPRRFARLEHRRGDLQVRRCGVGQDLAALLGVRSVEPHDDRESRSSSGRPPRGCPARPRRSA